MISKPDTSSYEIFTPDRISERMASFLNDDSKTLLDPAVGTGNLLKFLNHPETKVPKYQRIDCYDINSDFENELRSRTSEIPNVSIHIQDFLKANISMKYGHIILNPPYLKRQAIHEDYATFLKHEFGLTGNFDLYLPFLMKCLDLLADGGTMVSITPNTFLFNKSFSEFRKRILRDRLIHEIIDFKSEKVFNVDVYCCITVFTKKDKEHYLYNGVKYKYSDGESEIAKSKTDKTNKLSDIATITNGIATLRDKVFIHSEKLFDEPCWRPVLKVSKNQIHFIIYPYHNKKIIPEDEFKRVNPETYDYLLSCKEELAKRDRGNKKYEAWYAYGRKQGLIDETDLADKLYISTLSRKNVRIIETENMLFYSGVCIDTDEYDKVKNVINQSHDVLENSCSKRAGGWLNITVSVLKNLKY